MQLSRQDYFKKQRELSKSIAHAELEAARRIRKATRELVLPLVRQYAEQGMITYPTEELARQIDHIIREEAAKPVAAVRKLQDDMEASLAEKLGVSIRYRPKYQPELQENVRQRRLENAKEPVGTIIKTPGRGWGYGTSGLAAYHRDPQTGKIVWDDLPLEYQFRKRADLSEQVWKAVEEQEQMVFDVIRGGRAAGRNVKDICGDLEQFINYGDGGKRVVGRWMGMFPNTEEGRREAWKREYLTAHGGLQPGSDAAKALLRQPDAQAWVKQKMDETTKRGTPRLPSAVRSYATRLGKAGLDYRTIRIARTETTALVAMEQEAIAENSDICTGEMDFVMECGRDHWNCNCERYSEQSPWRVDDPERPEIPVHPSCVCEWRPRLRTDEEILAALREELKEEFETIEGTEEGREWQRDMLARIDEMEAEGVTVKSNPVTLSSLTDSGDDSWQPEEIQPASLRRNEPAIAKALEVEEKISKYSNEAAVIIDQNGNVVFDNPWGKKNEVNIDRNLIKDNVVTHNHTSGGPLSEDDMTKFVAYDAQEFRACTPSNINFSIRRGDGSIDKRIEHDYNLAMERIRNEATFEAFGHCKTGEEYITTKNNIIKEKANKWLAENAIKYGYIYTVEDRER